MPALDFFFWSGFIENQNELFTEPFIDKAGGLGRSSINSSNIH